MEDKLRANEVNLFGQRFHASVGVTYVGLGFVLAGALHRWFPDGTTWLTPVGLVTLLAGAAWWLLLWRWDKGREPASM